MNKEGVRKGVETLIKVIEKTKEEKNSLFNEDDETIFLNFNFSKLPAKVSPFKPHVIPLPHSLKKSDVQICMFVKDPASKTKELLESKNITIVNKVIDLSKLRKKYSRYEDRRQLSNSYDVFLADKSIVPSLPSALGKAFLQKKRYPVPIKLDKGDVLGNINGVLDSAVLFMGSGVNSAVRVGYHSSPVQHLVDNILSVAESVLTYLPSQWDSIQSIHIKSTNTISIPLYVVLPTAQVKIIPTLQQQNQQEEDEDTIVSEENKEAKAENEDVSVKEDNPVDPELSGSKKRTQRYMDAKKSPTKRVKSSAKSKQ